MIQNQATFARRFAPAICIGLVACGDPALLGGGPGAQPAEGSDASANEEELNATATQLSALELSDGNLAPQFNASVRAYTTTATKLPFTVRPTARDSRSTITVNGVAVASGQTSAPIALVPGSVVPVNIVVTAPNGRSAAYTIGTSFLSSSVSGEFQGQEAYVKPSNTRDKWRFGSAVAVSADGNTVAIGATGDASDARGINGDQTGTSSTDSGAVYVFVHGPSGWSQQAYIKASNSGPDLQFGGRLAISGDGNTLVVGAPNEKSSAHGVNSLNQNDTSFAESGAAYVFTRNGTTWSQEAYIKASNNSNNTLRFGWAVSLSTDGNTLAVGAPHDPSGAVGIDGADSDVTAFAAGAAYIFTRTSGSWAQRTYVKASNTREKASLGYSVSLSGAGDVLVVGSPGESSSSRVIDGDQSDSGEIAQGAAYVFKRQGATWAQTTYLKAASTRPGLRFGELVSISRDGSTIAVASTSDSSKAKGIDGDALDQTTDSAGAAWVFAPSGTSWSQQAYVKASNTSGTAYFGTSMALSDDGNLLAIGAIYEDGAATGLNGSQADANNNSGAAYVYRRSSNSLWSQKTYVKPSNTRKNAPPFELSSMMFGGALAYGGGVLVVGATGETSGATGINGDQQNQSRYLAGAAYIFR